MESTTDLICRFDELTRCYTVLLDSSCEKELLRYVSNQELFRLKWVETSNECKRLKDKLDTANKDISVLDGKLISARRWLDVERQQRKRIELERDALANQLEEVRRILLNDPRYKLSDETKEKLFFLNKAAIETYNCCRPTGCDRLNTIAESDSVISCLSDISFSRSGDDLDDIHMSHAPRSTMERKHRSSYLQEEPIVNKKQKSTEHSTYFTPTAPRIESINSLESAKVVTVVKNSKYDNNEYSSALDRINTRTHSFVSKTFIMPESCLWCSKKIGFGRMVFKCLDCNAISHPECRDKIPLPCIPMGTPTKKMGNGTISDYAPSIPPMIPAIVIHCINEVEQRGLCEVGIYRISGTEAVVRGLREKFLKGRGIPNLTDIDIHSICSCLKDFLRNLQDPLIPRAKWSVFANAISSSDKNNKLCEAVLVLPQANRDTLAFLILHLQKVASSVECKMSISNLATVFGPTIVGYSSDEQLSALAEAHTANAIMEELLSLPGKYWSEFIIEQSAHEQIPCTLYSTPSTESLMKKTSRKLLTTPGGRRKFFNTSPPVEKI